jgi:hypothetical protein
MLVVGIILLVIAVLTVILAVYTLVPSPKASKKNMIGYKSVCSLTPVSTVIMAMVAAGLVIVFVMIVR